MAPRLAPGAGALWRLMGGGGPILAETTCLPLPPGSATARRRNLVIVRAGRHSRHPEWTPRPGEQTFDLLVAAYEERPNAPDEWSVLVPGSKVTGYFRLLTTFPELLERYDYIALFDDDLVTTAADLDRLFEIGRRHDLDLFQPALTWDSYFSHAALLQNRGGYLLRFTNFVEMMCPVFSAAYLARALPVFGLGYETGIDLVWSRFGDAPHFRVAVVDAVAVTHTRPVGTTKTRQGFAADERYDRQMADVLAAFGVEFRGTVPYAAIRRDGRLVRSRYRVGMSSIRTWAACRRTPVPLGFFAWHALAHLRHAFFRPINLAKVPLQPMAPPA
jgi:hypothetical protein